MKIKLKNFLQNPKKLNLVRFTYSTINTPMLTFINVINDLTSIKNLNNAFITFKKKFTRYDCDSNVALNLEK